jgi:hypothetical protein
MVDRNMPPRAGRYTNASDISVLLEAIGGAILPALEALCYSTFGRSGHIKG